MLLIHQAGSVKVGEVVRYTITYTPSSDRILPSPHQLYVKIKNESAIPLRAAYLHGPYALHVCAYPTTFNPNAKYETQERDGAPEFEPNLKAGGHWHAKLTIPEDIRDSGDKAGSQRSSDRTKSVTWIIEVASQILFSDTASVHYELLVGRDSRSLDIGFAAVAGQGHAEPGQIEDFIKIHNTDKRRATQPKGVYSKAITLDVEDTVTLWNKPPLPQWPKPELSGPTKPNLDSNTPNHDEQVAEEKPPGAKKPKSVHLVVLTHGLHSNLGADLLYLKESIDATIKKAREDKRKRKADERKNTRTGRSSKQSQESKDSKSENKEEATSTAPLSGGQEDMINEDEDEADDDEEVVVRGFPGNVVRTERGIQYLGKRLAKFVLTFTYPDQPFLPASKSMARSFTFADGLPFPGKTPGSHPHHGKAAHSGSSVYKGLASDELRPYKFTKISFIGHSLGGLIQMYAIGYIHKHSPEFFRRIKPQSFVTMASPMLGLSNENPMYIKFALDFGLVGRSGRDLGLFWKAPNIARNGWNAVLSGLGANSTPKKENQDDPRAKPLLRILPTGPAHKVLKMFQNRTVYSNVVNDGVVPLRTSCLLFLDWRGLERVENVRRENGFFSTMAAFGWAELTGATTTSASHRPRSRAYSESASESGSSRDQSPSKAEDKGVPQPPSTATKDDNTDQLQEPGQHQFLNSAHAQENQQDKRQPNKSPTNPVNAAFNDFLNLFRPDSPKAHGDNPKPAHASKKTTERFRRAQTVGMDSDDNLGHDGTQESKKPGAPSMDSAQSSEERNPPPKTSVFEAAGDILHPPIPTPSWLNDPSARQRTIFHDRVYHPSDIPPPPAPRKRHPLKSSSQTSLQSTLSQEDEAYAMRVEEKIARAYHRDLSWRKVLVRLEPDAHNNMIVRRMFANAYGWDVVKHLCDTHFADTYSATTNDSQESSQDRAKGASHQPTEEGEEVYGQTKSSTGPQRRKQDRTISEMREATDKVEDLDDQNDRREHLSSASHGEHRLSHQDSIGSDIWSDSAFNSSEDEEENTTEEPRSPLEAFHKFWKTNVAKSEQPRSQSAPADPREKSNTSDSNVTKKERSHKYSSGTSDAEIAEFLSQTPQLLQSEGIPDAPGGSSVTEPTFEAGARPDDLPTESLAHGGAATPAALGLKSSAEESMDRNEHKRRASLGEQVAKLDMTGSRGS